MWGPRLNSDWDLTFWRKLLETACCFRAHGEMCRTPSCREMICSPHSGGGQSWWVICESKAAFGGVVWCWNRDDWMALRDLISVLTRQKAIETSGRSLAAGVEVLPDFRPAFPAVGVCSGTVPSDSVVTALLHRRTLRTPRENPAAVQSASPDESVGDSRWPGHIFTMSGHPFL